MIFKLNENETVELKYSFRSSIYFEQITNKNVDFQNFTANDFITLFYSVVLASLQKAKMPTITMLDFLDKIDDYNGGEKCLVEFSNWYVETMKAQYDILESINDDTKEKPETTTGKKKQA